MEEKRKEIPFMEQVKLFATTMNERFIEGNNECGKVLIVFAMDTNNGKGIDGKVEHIGAVYGNEFDTSYCIMMALHRKEILDVFTKSASLSIIIDAIAKAKGFELE